MSRIVAWSEFGEEQVFTAEELVGRYVGRSVDHSDGQLEALNHQVEALTTLCGALVECAVLTDTGASQDLLDTLMPWTYTHIEVKP